MGAEASQVDQALSVSAGQHNSQYSQYQNQHERFSDEKFEPRRGGNKYPYHNRRGRGGVPRNWNPNQNKRGTGRDVSPAGSECSERGGGPRNRNPYQNKQGASRDVSPVGSEYSERGGQQRGPRNQPTKNYDDVIKKHTDKKIVSKNFKGQENCREQKGNQDIPSRNNLGNTKTVDALNDLLKKEFGSVGGSIHNLPVMEFNEKPFSGRNCIYIGNLPADLNRGQVNALMSPYGDVTVDYYNTEKKFGFIRLKYREQAENAQRNLDGFVFKGRTLKVRLASTTARFKVLNLTPWVTNELLKKAFSVFGEVERAEIVVEGGKPTGEGLIEFSYQKAGQAALEACVENCFLLTKALRPVMLEEMDPDNGLRGFSERQLPKNNPECKKAREIGPRFLLEKQTKYACALLWKNFIERKRREEEELAEKFRLEENQLEARIESLLKEYRDF